MGQCSCGKYAFGILGLDEQGRCVDCEVAADERERKLEQEYARRRPKKRTETTDNAANAAKEE